MLTLERVLRIPVQDWYRPPKGPAYDKARRMRRTSEELAIAKAAADAAVQASRERAAAEAARVAKKAAADARATAKKGPVKTKTGRSHTAPKRKTGTSG